MLFRDGGFEVGTCFRMRKNRTQFTHTDLAVDLILICKGPVPPGEPNLPFQS